jgi:hypothetical protein
VKAHALVPAASGAEALVGRVPCHDLRDEAGRLVARKGQRLDPAAAARVAAAVRREAHLLEVEPGDLHEDAAGERLAGAAAGGGVRVRGAAGGQWSLVADHRGLLRVRVAALAAVNALEGISVYTLFDGRVVEPGEVVARAKVTPLVVAEAAVVAAERRCRRADGLVAVRPFRPLGVAAVAPDRLEPGVRARFEEALREKLAWFGARCVDVAFVPARPGALAAALQAAGARGADLVVAAGANALDPLDPLFGALERLDARLVRVGAPAHPGSLLWLAMLGPTPVLGMPSCGMFSEATLFDLLLPRFLAGEPVGPEDLAAVGHGGLLGREMAFRFPPYRSGRERGSVGGGGETP